MGLGCFLSRCLTPISPPLVKCADLRDPLAAALAAGETPSPEMVAAAGTNEAISLQAALAGAAWIVLALAASVLMFERVMLVNRTPPAKPPAALQDRAEEALQKLGYGDDVVGRASGLGLSLDFARYIEQTSQAPDRWDLLRHGRPETTLFWYRTSPRPLVPWGVDNPLASTNPPLTVAGMTPADSTMCGRRCGQGMSSGHLGSAVAFTA